MAEMIAIWITCWYLPYNIYAYKLPGSNQSENNFETESVWQQKYQLLEQLDSLRYIKFF